MDPQVKIVVLEKLDNDKKASNCKWAFKNLNFCRLPSRLIINIFSAIFELILPVAIIASMAFYYNQIKESTNGSKTFEPFDLSSASCAKSIATKVGIYPKDAVIEDLVKKALQSTFEVSYFDNELKLAEWLESSKNTAMGIVFSPSFVSLKTHCYTSNVQTITEII